MEEPTLAIIGAGMIGRALIEGLLKSEYPGRIIATRRQVEKIKDLEEAGVKVTSNNREAAEEADIIILCVKPSQIHEVLKEIENEVKGKLVISFAAAIRLKSMKKIIPEAHFIRAMPNLAILVQEAPIAYCTDSQVTTEEERLAKHVLERSGRLIKVHEEEMDAVTALSGCCPAYLSIILEALTYAGLEVGLPKSIALFSAAQSMIGTGRLVLEAGLHPAEIRDMVTTPGGVTVEGIHKLEETPIRHAFMKAVKAATAKSAKISEKLKDGTG